MADQPAQTPAQAAATAAPPPKQRTVEDEQARMMQVTSFGGWLSLCVVGAQAPFG